MSNLNYMPLHGALLISNPRKNSMPTFVNPKRRHQNWANKSGASQKRAGIRFQLRNKYRGLGGDNWANDASLKASYHAELESQQALPASVYQARGGKLSGGSARSNPAASKRKMSKRQKAMYAAGGQPLGKNYKASKKKIHAIDFLKDRRDAGQMGSFYYPKASQFKAHDKRKKVSVNWKNQYGSGTSSKWVVNSAARGRRRANVSDKNRMLAVKVGPVSDKADSLGHFFSEGGRFSSVVSKRKSAGKSGSRGPNPWVEFRKAHPGLSIKEQSALYKQAKANPRGAKSYYRQKHYGALALDNYGALALDNYGALALDNPVPFVGGVVASAGKLALTGLVGALGHAYVSPKAEDLIEKIPGASMLLELEVPEAVPLIGGMPLTNTIVGIITGAAILAASQYAGRKFGQPMVAQYGSALGAGIALVGPVVDFVSQDDADEDLAGLALDNYGGLALDNEGTFGDAGSYGDGMAYQIGAITSEDQTDFGQCSLGDAYYSGADFDLGEGQALLNGRHAFRSRFGHAPQRIANHGGRSSGASHLAGRPGHRWGWLIQMIGWANVQKLAAMPPKQRVAAIGKLRANALESFKQIQVESQEQILAAPELVPLGADGPDGVGGAFGAYGATIFGGAGL